MKLEDERDVTKYERKILDTTGDISNGAKYREKDGTFQLQYI